MFTGGFVGVDIFFVISGYLITTILIADQDRGDFSIARFYERRARRILPALCVVMAACLPFAWAWMLPSQLQDFGQSVVAVIFFASNILFWQESGYFSAAAELKPLLHTWTLAVEEQYYLVLPLFLWAAWRLGRARVAGIILLTAALSLALAEWGARALPDAAFYLAPFRAWELLAGSLCAFHLSGRAQPRSDALAALGLGLILFALVAFDGDTRHPSLWTLAPVGGAALIVLYAERTTLVARLLSSAPFVGVGLVSYSAYLWHQPLFAFARLHEGMHPAPALMGALAGASLLLAWGSWRYVEQPFRKGAQGLAPTRRAVFAASAAACALFVAVGAAGHLRHGFPDRFIGAELEGDVGHDVFLALVDNDYVDCEPESVARTSMVWEGFLRCKQTRPGPADLVLLGDSHAEHLFLGLAEALHGTNVVFFNQDAIPFLDQPDFAAMYAWLLKGAQPSVVVMGHSRIRFDRMAGREDAYQAGMAAAIRALQAAGRRVILTRDLPSFPSNAETCIYSAQLPTAHACIQSREEAQAQLAPADAALRKLTELTGAPLIGYEDAICDARDCSMIDGKEILFRDSHHLNVIGSRRAGKLVAARLREMGPFAAPQQGAAEAAAH